MATEQRAGNAWDGLPLRAGAIFGVAAYVASYALTYVLLTVDGDFDPGAYAAGDTVSEYQVVGWVFYNAHFVDTEAAGIFEGSGNFLSEEAFQFPSLVYYGVVILVLVAAGYGLARSLGREWPDTGAAAKAGVAVVVGYLPLAVVGALLVTVEESGNVGGVEFSQSVGPDLGLAIVLAGLLLPAVLGAAGAGIAAET